MAKAPPFSVDAAKRIIRTVKGFEGGDGFGTSGPSQGSNGRGSPAWCMVTSHTDPYNPKWRFAYKVSVYAYPSSPLDTAPAALSTDQDAFNSTELNATATTYGDYTIHRGSTTPCEIKEILPAPSGVPLRIEGRYWMEGKWRYIFAWQNTPVLVDPEDS